MYVPMLQWIGLSKPYSNSCLTKFNDIETKLYPVHGISLVASLISDIYSFN